MGNAAQYIALGRDIRAGLGDIGNAKLSSAQLQHQLGRQQRGDERQAKMDAYAEPGLKLAQMQNQTQLGELQRQNERNTAPIENMRDLLSGTFGDMDDKGIAFIATNNVLPKIAKANNWQFDGKTYRKTGPDGKLAPITQQDLYDNQAFTKSVVEASVDPGHALNDMIDRAKAVIPAMQDPNQKAQAVQALRRLEQKQQDPRWLLNAYHNQSKKILQGITTLKAAGRDTSMLEDSYQRVLDKANKWGDRVYVDPMQKKEFDLRMKIAEAQLERLRRPPQENVKPPSAAELKMQSEQAAQQQEYALRNALGEAGELGIDIQVGQDEAGNRQIGGFLTVDQKEDFDEILAKQGFKAYYKSARRGSIPGFRTDGLTITDIVPMQGGGGEQQTQGLESGTPEYDSTLKEITGAIESAGDMDEARVTNIVNGARKKYGEAFANDLSSKLVNKQKEQTNPEKTSKPVEKAKTTTTKKTAQQNKPPGVLQIGDDGRIYEIRPDGTPVRFKVMEGEDPIFPWGAGAADPHYRMGGKKYTNQKYKTFMERLKELGLYDEYVRRFGKQEME